MCTQRHTPPRGDGPRSSLYSLHVSFTEQPHIPVRSRKEVSPRPGSIGDEGALLEKM